MNLYLLGGGALLLAALGWFGQHEWKAKMAAEARLTTVTQQLKAERENTRIANESATRYAARIQALRNAPHSSPPVLMCRLPARVRPVPAATAGTHDPVPADNPGVSEPVDIGPRLAVPHGACEENLIKGEELQRWIREALQTPRRLR